MAKVLGIGGIFFKSPDPARLKQWYVRWLGFSAAEAGPAVIFFADNLTVNGYTVWSPFEATTNYFDPLGKEFMVNLMVDNLDEALAQVREGGAQTVGEVEALEYGRFGWFIDPDGNKVELWESPR